MMGPPRQAPAGSLSLEHAAISAAIEKRLFVGKVPPGTTEEELAEAFSVYGKLLECRVVPDRNGGSSNGIGFVSYGSWGAAHRAQLETDGRKALQGHHGTSATLVTSFAERKNMRGRGAPYAKGLDVSRVFVGVLPEDASQDEISARFSAIGDVESCALLPAKGRARCAFVTFRIWGEAMDAVEVLHGQPLRPGSDLNMTVVLAQPKEGGHHGAAPRGGGGGGGGGVVVPGSLAREVPPRGGEPQPKRQRLGQEEGQGSMELNVLLAAYNTAVNGDSPRSACDVLHDQLMRARDRLWGERSEREWTPLRGGGGGGGGGGDGRLFVGGLPHDCVDEDLVSLVAQLGFQTPAHRCRVLECRVLEGRGCGYVRYNSREAADEAFAALQGRQVEGWAGPLRVQWAARKVQPDVAAVQAAVTSDPGERALDAQCFLGQGEVEAEGMEPTRLFVGQVTRDADVGRLLRPMFEAYGPLQEWRYVQEKGIIYVGYAHFEEANAAMQGMSNLAIPGVSKGLNVKYSQRRS